MSSFFVLFCCALLQLDAVVVWTHFLLTCTHEFTAHPSLDATAKTEPDVEAPDDDDDDDEDDADDDDDDDDE